MQGFTLVELLVVISIILLLSALIVPAIGPMFKGTQMTQAEQLIEAQLSLARQTALTKNLSVEVRFYQFANPNMPGEVAGTPASGKFRAIQCFGISDSGAAAPIGRMERLPDSVVIDSGSTLCSLIGLAQVSPAVPTKDTGAHINVPITTVSTQYNCVFFHFLPDGSTDLPPSQRWFLTLHALTDGDNRGAPPANFRTIQVDPTNGHVYFYRP